ncbi:MAG: hypothetical protein K0R67_4026, partial [Paenibacillus sp.]|nr:hypothetical protein [Paenibacillus sp.]
MKEKTTFSREEITYALFELDPEAYYKARFANHNVIGIVANEGLVVRNSLVYQKASYLYEALRRCRPDHQPVKVLEVGCGSGTFGARVKQFFPDVDLYGVDMSSSCIEIAKQNGFDHVLTYDVVRGLPYGDNEFDFVYTMDFLGHIEFRNKNSMIAEMNRITKPGGYGFHGIETGYINYLNCNPKDPDDIVRKYVYAEGHIGVEMLDDILDRFAKHFEIVQAFPFPIRPMLNISNIINSGFWGEDFNKAFAEIDSPSNRITADLVIGWCNKYLTDQLFKVYGDVLAPSRIQTSNHSAVNQFTG